MSLDLQNVIILTKNVLGSLAGKRLTRAKNDRLYFQQTISMFSGQLPSHIFLKVLEFSPILCIFTLTRSSCEKALLEADLGFFF